MEKVVLASARDWDYYREKYRTMEVLPEWQGRVDRAVALVKRYQADYEGFGTLPWYVIGLIHLMESNCNFARQIWNGERWDQVTTLVPKGRGPWVNWRASTEEALFEWGCQRVAGTGPAAALLEAYRQGIRQGAPELVLAGLERWNGMGYAKRGVNSPYLWSGSNHGVGVGKYTADGKYDPLAVSGQVGAAVVMKGLGVGS